MLWKLPNVVRSFKLRALLSVVLCIAVLAAGLGTFMFLASLKQPLDARPIEERVYMVEVFDLQRTDLQEIISAFGTARADREVVLSAQVPGVIVETHPVLEIGRFVEAPAKESESSVGDLLVRIDPEPFHVAITQAEKRLAEDDAELKRLKQEETNNLGMLVKVEADYELIKKENQRIVNLRKDDVVTRSQAVRALLELQQYEQTLIKHQNEKALIPLRAKQVESRKATHESDLAAAKLDLKHSTVRPPFSGTLSETMVEQGKFVRVGDPLVRLTDDSSVEIPVPVSLKEYAEIKRKVLSGDYPQVSLAENESDQPRWSGNVVRVAPQADELTRTVEVYVEVENRTNAGDGVETPLLPGTFVHARIDGPIHTNVHVVPRDAIVKGKIYVSTREGLSPKDLKGLSKEEQAKLRLVREIAIKPPTSLQSLALVEAGLNNTEEIILTNLDILSSLFAKPGIGNQTEVRIKVSVHSHRTLADELRKQRTTIVRPLLLGKRNGKPEKTQRIESGS